MRGRTKSRRDGRDSRHGHETGRSAAYQSGEGITALQRLTPRDRRPYAPLVLMHPEAGTRGPLRGKPKRRLRRQSRRRSLPSRQTAIPACGGAIAALQRLAPRESRPHDSFVLTPVWGGHEGPAPREAKAVSAAAEPPSQFAETANCHPRQRRGGHTHSKAASRRRAPARDALPIPQSAIRIPQSRGRQPFFAGASFFSSGLSTSILMGRGSTPHLIMASSMAFGVLPFSLW